eukprot:2436370-Rhodomonas_salina.1
MGCGREGGRDLVRHVGVAALLVRPAAALARALELLHAVRVPQGVHRVLARGGARRHVGDHDGAAVADEGVLEHRRQRAPPERHVLAVLVQRPDALLHTPAPTRTTQRHTRLSR